MCTYLLQRPPPRREDSAKSTMREIPKNNHNTQCQFYAIVGSIFKINLRVVAQISTPKSPVSGQYITSTRASYTRRICWGSRDAGTEEYIRPPAKMRAALKYPPYPPTGAGLRGPGRFHSAVGRWKAAECGCGSWISGEARRQMMRISSARSTATATA